MRNSGDTVILGSTKHLVIECGDCGVLHTVPLVMHQNAQREGGFWSCPNGHRRGYPESASERAKEAERQEEILRERDRLKQDAARRDDEERVLRGEIAKQEKERRRILARANAGVCQDCNRHFNNVALHRTTKHKRACLQVVA